jgi:hypothetical protein
MGKTRTRKTGEKFLEPEANPHQARNLIEEFSLPNMGVTVHLKDIRLERAA